MNSLTATTASHVPFESNAAARARDLAARQAQSTSENAAAERAAAVDEITVTAKKPDDETMSFWDLLDFINPLQHIPVVNTIYRELTGDTIKTPAKLVGSTLLGGPIGFAAAMVDSIIEERTGKDMGGHVMAMLRGEPDPTQDKTQIAADGRSRVSATTNAGREFIPEAVSPVTLTIAQNAVTPTPTASAQAVPNQTAPSQAEAMITAAQIAAKAQVAMPLKRGQIANTQLGARPLERAAVDSMNGPAVARATQSRFMPLNPEATQGRDFRSPVRRTVEPATTVDVLRARSKFSPGPLGVGGGALPQANPALAAAAVRGRNDDPGVPATGTADPGLENMRLGPASAEKADARARYDYALKAASGDAVEVPTWFDDAMLSAIDKYHAAASRTAVAPTTSRQLY